MVITTKLGVVAQTSNGAVVFLKKARQCGVCGVMAMIVVNAEGRTTCVNCAPEIKSP
jgi:hypothetical protein